MTKLIRDLMHPGVFTCRPDATLGEVAVMLTQHHVHALLVTDRDGRPIGVISDYDLLAAEWLSADRDGLEAMRAMTAGELMSTPVNTIDADALATTFFILGSRKGRELLNGIGRIRALYVDHEGHFINDRKKE